MTNIITEEDIENRMIPCDRCGFRILVMYDDVDNLRMVNPMCISYCPICGKALHTKKELFDYMTDLEYELMCKRKEE